MTDDEPELAADGAGDPLRGEDTPVADVFENARDAVLDDLGETHGGIHENFTQTADLWGDYLGVHVDPVDVAVLNILQKVSRQDSGSRDPDHFTDMAGYAAIANGLARAGYDHEDDDTDVATDGGRTQAHTTDGSEPADSIARYDGFVTPYGGDR